MGQQTPARNDFKNITIVNTIKIATLNVNGISRHKKRTRIFNYLRSLKADIFCLQETHGANKNITDRWTEEWGGQAFWSHGSHKSRGTSILLRTNMDAQIISNIKDNDGRVMSIILNYQNFEANIISIYAPTDDTERRHFFRALQDFPTATQYVVVAGDFNCITDLKYDKDGGNPIRGLAGNKELTDWTKTLNLVDTWRVENPSIKGYTWFNANNSIRTRIDKIFTQKTFADKTKTTVNVCPYSDHDAVMTTIKIPDSNPRGPGVWKMNTKLLKDKRYEHEIRSFTKHWMNEKDRDENPTKWWDDYKEHVKIISIKHAIKKAKARRALKERLTKVLNDLQQADIPDNEQIKEKNAKLKQILNEEAEGNQIRSRAKWFEEGEKPTRYFFGLEKSRQKNNTINRLKKEDTTLTNDIEILEEAKNFYQKLYNTEQTNLTDQEWILQQLEKKLTETDKEFCEGPMTEKETTNALNEIDNNKSPGPDGIPGEFYKLFWDLLKQPLTDLFNYNFDNETMTESQQKALLKLLFKKNDIELLKNWRPISLLNTDYKIAAKVIATRLKHVLGSITHEDQTCGIPGRSIYENLFKLRDTVYNAHKHKQQMIMISLDQEKAFDRVDRDFLNKTMDKLNFGPSFKNWIKTLYKNANCAIINNGWMSDPVTLQRGLRQGCPLSPLLYVMIAESLGQAIRNDPSIKGVHIPGDNGKTDKISQYADDATLILKDGISVQRAFDVVNKYERGSGSKLNYEKSEGIYIGQQEGKNTGPVPITWKTDNIAVLGTQIGPSLEQDWDKPVAKLLKRIQGWYSRNLTIYGRALIVKTYGVANLIYLATTFSIPEKVIVEVHRAIFNFLWKGHEYVKRETMCLPLKEGGLAIPDLRKTNVTMKVKWLKEIGDKKYQRSWIKWPRYYIGTALSTVKENWIFLRDNKYPHADPNSVPDWYIIVQKMAKKFKEQLRQMEQKEITNKNMLILMNEEIEEPRANRKWKEEWKIDEQKMSEHWKTIWKSLNSNWEKDNLWKLTHMALPTMTNLTKWKINGVKDKCPFCKQSEDLKHVFIECSRTKPLWDYVNSLIEKITGKTPPPPALDEAIFLTKTTMKDPIQWKLVKYVSTTSLTVIWNTRNAKLKDTKIPELKQELRRRIKERINTDVTNNKESNLKNIWSYENVLIKVNSDQITFML